MDIFDRATSLALARIVVGATAWIAPDRSLRAGMLDGTPQSMFLLRLFGIRDAALGAVALMAARTAPSAASARSTRAALLKVGMAVDGADAAASLLAWKSGAVRPSTGALFTGVALAAVAAGAAAAGRQQ